MTTEAHPLFPAANEDTDPPEVSTIHVTRIPDGTHYRAFQPEELTSYEQIYQMFGGGQYILLARNGSHISGRTTVTLPGKAKPLNPAPEDDEAPRQPVYAQPAPAPAAGDPTMVLAMMQMMQANTTAMMQMMLKQSEGQTQMMLAVMNQGSGASREYIQVMQGLHNQHSAEQAALLKSVVDATRNQNASSSGGEMGGFMRGVEFARQFATGGGRRLGDRGNLRDHAPLPRWDGGSEKRRGARR